MSAIFLIKTIDYLVLLRRRITPKPNKPEASKGNAAGTGTDEGEATKKSCLVALP